MSRTIYRTRRAASAAILALAIIGFGLFSQFTTEAPAPSPSPTQPPQAVAGDTTQSNTENSTLAGIVLDMLPVKGRAPKTNYERSLFGNGWQSVEGCDMRNRILARDLTNIILVENNFCLVLSGNLNDPYTGATIVFQRGNNTSSLVQIDHVVALSDAWQKGAQLLSPEQRLAFANDPLELIAVDGATNQKKSDGDAATWLPPNKAFRCQYVARQIAVKQKYSLWITQAEKDAIKKVLEGCPGQALPIP